MGNTRIDVNTRRILDNLHDGVYVVSPDMRIQYWNAGAERITGYTAEEVLGSRCSDDILRHVDDGGTNLCMGICPLKHSIGDQQLREAELFLHHKDGHRVPIQVRTSVLTDDSGKVLQGIELFSDMTGKDANLLRIKELERLMMLDPLTQLANRNFIEKELTSRIDEFSRYEMPFGILFFDIDHFKAVNDTYGHLAGDEVLMMVSANMIANARPFDLFGRWGGEEFIGIIRNINEVQLQAMAERLRMLTEQSYLFFEDQRISVTISIGATMMNTEDTSESLVSRADELMYKSKSSGRNRVSFA